MRCVALCFFSLVLLCAPAISHASGGRCERIVLVPLDPVGLSPKDAREEEDRVREALSTIQTACLTPREQTGAALKQLEGRRLPPCGDVECRRKLAAHFDADWLFSGTAFGFGGGRSITLSLWNRDGTLVQRGSFASGPGMDPKSGAAVVVDLLREARLGRSIASANERSGTASSMRSHWPEIALGAGAVAALAAGVALGAASRDISARVAEGRTGCAGTGDAYESCFANTVHAGRNQATAANLLFGAGALLGAGATVFFVVDLP